MTPQHDESLVAGTSGGYATAMAIAGRSRRFTYPEQGDTIASIAAREVPGGSEADVLSWNLHIAMRPFPADGPGALLCGDIVYLEPPPTA